MKITKEDIDNLNKGDTLLLLRTTSNDKVFFGDIMNGRRTLDNIKLELCVDDEYFANNTIYDNHRGTREVPYQIKIMTYGKVGTPYIERWVWTNSVDRNSWDWFYATYCMLKRKQFTSDELFVMSEQSVIRNYKLISLGV